MRVRILLSVLAAVAIAAPAGAQSLEVAPATAPVPAQSGAGSSSIGVRAFGLYDFVSLSASDSFDAAFETSKVNGFGAGVEVTNLWKGVFGRVTFSKLSLDDGSRAHVVNGVAIPTGVPLAVEMSPIEFGAGWRQSLDPVDRYVAYAGASALRMKYTETSSFAAMSENVDENYNGYAIFAGLDVLAASWVFVGAEFQYRSVPDAIGAGGLSLAFDENDLGGTAFRILFGVRK